MLAGSNPAARTRQSQSPRSPYRGAGRLFFRTRFAGSTTFCRCLIMICGFSLSMPPRLPNCDMRFLPHQSPRLPSRFPAPLYRRVLFDPPCRSPIRFGGTRCRRFPPSVPFPIGWEGSAPAPLPASLSVQSASRLSPRLAFRRAAWCLRSFVQMDREDACFPRTYPFSPSLSSQHVIHLIDIHAGVVERQTRQI